MFNIPESHLPEYLKDENRISVLFAPIRSRSVNPKDWDNKISSWKNIIKVYCETNDIYTFTYSSLIEVFVRNGRPPACLLEVLKEMEKDGEVQLLSTFLKTNSKTWTGWATDVFIRTPISWSYNKVKQSFFSTDVNQTLVHLQVIKSKCDDLLNTLPAQCKNKLISLKELLLLLNKSPNEVEGIKLLLHYLSNQKLVEFTNLNNSKQNDLETVLIKFSNGADPIITEVDIGIYTLEHNEKVIVKAIEEMEDNIQHCVNEAKEHLSKNHRQLAKSCLRKKKDLEVHLEKKVNALHNIQKLLQQIDNTHSNTQIWESYKKVLTAFDFTYKDTGISEDIIDDTMIKLGEVLDKNEDIQAALAQPARDTINESDLEEELAELMKESPHDGPPDDGGLNTSHLEDKLNILSLNLPDVPAQSPNISQQELNLINL